MRARAALSYLPPDAELLVKQLVERLEGQEPWASSDAAAADAHALAGVLAGERVRDLRRRAK